MSRMTPARSIALVLIVVLNTTATASAQSPEIIVETDRAEVYEGESLLYRVTLNHVENPSEPQLNEFDDFQIAKLGEQSLNSSQITIINGVRNEIVRRGRQYSYRLTPRRSGRLTIPSPSAEIDGQVIRGREVTLQVIPPDDQETVILEMSVDRETVYPMQPFTLLLTMAIKSLPGDLSGRDPLSVQQDPPLLSVGWMDDEQIPDGLEPSRSWREILEPLVRRRGQGVRINNIGSSSVFSLFGREATTFRPEPESTTRTDADGAEAEYWEFRFERTMIPRQLGTYEFGPVNLKGTFATDVQNGRLVGEKLFAVANNVAVTVRDVPLEGRPDSYIGAVGRFDVTSQLVPNIARVGDPMTLTVTLNGRGSLADAHPPEIASLTGVEGAFRTYEATEETSGDSRRFTYSLRPLRSDVSEFPAIPVSYFDVEQEQYVTIGTPSIALDISEAEQLADSDIISSGGDVSAATSQLQASEGGVFANDSDLKSLRNEAVHPRRWIGLWSGMILCYAAATTIIGRVRRLRDDPALLRRRAAPARARKALQDVTSQGNANGSATCEGLQRVVTGLIADFAGVPEAGLTPRDAAQRLEAIGVDDGLRDRTFDFLNQCDAARYGTAVDDIAWLEKDADSLVASLAGELKKKSC